jgi:antitoxin component YwqK of YwqJK toxin-antitoxin module
LKIRHFILFFIILISCKGKIGNSNYLFYEEEGKQGYWQKTTKNSNFKYKKGKLSYFYKNGIRFGEIEVLDSLPNRIEKFYDKKTDRLTKTVWVKNDLEYKTVYENGYYKNYYSNKGEIVIEEGLVENNLEQGLWKRYWNEDGVLKETINFKDGKIHGERKNYWKNGNLKSFAYWDLGIQSGKGFFYYENGNIEESNYRFNEKLHGEYKAYYPDKTLKTDCNYWNNQTLDTCRNYYPNGNLKKLELYKLDTISLESSGKALFYYESGKLQIETEVINYKPNGIAKYYNKQGKLIEIITFENGVKIKSTLK